jgi:hypothetical protein
MVQTEIEQQVNIGIDEGETPILDLSGMKTPERFSAVKNMFETLELVPYEVEKIHATMPADLMRYSPRNRILVKLQRPGVQAVKGRRQWFQEGRILKKGCKAIWVLAPSKKKKKATKEGEEDQESLEGFFFIPVYDQRDTRPKEK